MSFHLTVLPIILVCLEQNSNCFWSAVDWVGRDIVCENSEWKMKQSTGKGYSIIIYGFHEFSFHRFTQTIQWNTS
jgi:hypothetical protein